MNRKRIFLIITITIYQVFALTASAQEQQKMDTPDFKHCFEVLRRSRTIHDQYNDSLLMVKNKTEWINLWKRRKVRMQQLYDYNYAQQHPLRALRKKQMDELPLKVYADLFDDYYNRIYSKRELDKPFTLLSVCKVLESGGERVQNALQCVNVVNAWKLYAYCKLWNMGGNKEYLHKAYESAKYLMSDEAKKHPYYDYAVSQAFRYLPKTIWVKFHVQTIAEYRDCARKLGELLARPDIHEVVSPSLYAELQRIYDTSEESLVRNIYQPGDNKQLISKQVGDSLMAEVVRQNQAKPDLPCLSYIRTQYMMMDLGLITPNEAREECLRRYRLNWEKIKDKHLTALELNDYLQPFYTFFYINYKASIPVEEKRKTVVDMCHDISWAYKNRQNKEFSTDYVRDLLFLSTYDKVSMYLTQEEVAKFLNVLNLTTQVGTYAHSQAIYQKADVVIKDVLKYKPELFVGTLGCKTVDDVKKNSKALVSYAQRAALCHDLGKNSIAYIADVDFRPYFVEEEQLMQRHPEFGLKYLSLTPELKNFHDVTLGHHKWYDGKGGYPENFDNTQSPVRIFIDIISLCDGILDQAIEHVDKQQEAGYADLILKNMEAGAGTRYNPELVKLIGEHPDVRKHFDSFVQHDWLQAYYEAYKAYAAAKK